MDLPVSVIIPTYRDWRRLETCLRALRGQTIGADAFEVIVANNDPADPAPPFALAPNERIVVEPKPGSYAARNAALAVAQGRAYAFTDSDCVPDPDWIERGLAAIGSQPEARISGSIPVFREPGSSALAHLFDFHTAFRQREYAERGVAATANMMVSADVFRRVGPFDGTLFSGGDFDWNHRASDLGVPILFREAMIVRHPARERIGDIFRKRRRTSRAEGGSKRFGIRGYVLSQLAPPFNRVVYDRATPTPVERGTIFMLLWAMGVYAASQFTLVRFGLIKPVRS